MSRLSLNSYEDFTRISSIYHMSTKRIRPDDKNPTTNKCECDERKEEEEEESARERDREERNPFSDLRKNFDSNAIHMILKFC